MFHCKGCDDCNEIYSKCIGWACNNIPYNHFICKFKHLTNEMLASQPAGTLQNAIVCAQKHDCECDEIILQEIKITLECIKMGKNNADNSNHTDNSNHSNHSNHTSQITYLQNIYDKYKK
jgi:hypothetical protein